LDIYGNYEQSDNDVLFCTATREPVSMKPARARGK